MPDFVFISASGAILTPGALGTDGVVVAVVIVVVMVAALPAEDSAPAAAAEDAAAEEESPAGAMSPRAAAAGAATAALIAAPVSICRRRPEGAGCGSSSAGLVTSGADQRLFRLDTGIVTGAPAPSIIRGVATPDDADSVVVVVVDGSCV